MRATIYYFSGTGNSLKIARDLSSELDQAEVIFIPDVIGNDEIRADADVVGIVYPVYMFGPPVIVLGFIKKLVVRRDTYVFITTNYADMGGGAVSLAEAELRKQGIKLSSAFGMRMPSNYTPFGGAPTEKKQKDLFAKETSKVREIADVVRSKREGPVEKPFFLIDLIGIALFRLLMPRIPSMDKEFWADNGCTSCALCEKVCPVGNIKLEDGRPRWMSQCQQCLACLQWCPKEAIQFGKMTRGRKRYHNPDVELKDIMRKG